jgi:hypothetical protein
MTAIMKNMVRIEQRNQNIDIQQRAHGLHVFAIHQIPDMIERYHFPARRQQRNAAPCLLG